MKAVETHATSELASFLDSAPENWAVPMTMISKSRKWSDPWPISGAGKSSECASPRWDLPILTIVFSFHL